MSKIGVTLLIIATIVGGYYLAIGRDSKDAGEKIDLFASSRSETQTQNEQQNPPTKEAVKEESKKITNDNIEKFMTATLHTSKGDITIEFNKETPKTVENFINLAKSGFYDGTKFHRVIKGFMSQGGDPFSKDDSNKSSWGKGGPGYKFDDEINSNNKNNIDTIAMANSGPNTNGSQFFINAANNNYLDSKHTVFGKIISGKNVALEINSVATDKDDRPIEPVILKSITLK